MTPRPENAANWIPLPGLLDIASAALFEQFRAELDQSEFRDIRPTHGCVFRYVKGPGLRLTDIAERANMTKQSVGEIVDDLAERGYVKRIPDPDDRRAKLICLTERGEEAQAYGLSTFAKVEEQWAERYGAERIATLREFLEELVAAEVPFAVPELASPEHAAA